MDSTYLTPRQIVEELDKYIIGQDDAKRNMAIALRNRWRRMNITSPIQSEILPNNILMIGTTGVGKTEIARRLAKITDAPFVKVEASKFTEVGYVGRDVESMVRDLAEKSVNIIKAIKKEQVKEKANQGVTESILDALIPPLRDTPSLTSVAPAGAEHKGDKSSSNDIELNEQTRNLFREKIIKGELEDRKIDIYTKQKSRPSVGMIGTGMMDEASMANIQEMINGILPQEPRKRKVTVAEARKILFEEEVSKLIDMAEVKEEAIMKVENSGIIFIDEIDKVVSTSGKKGGGPDVSREGVQRDLLPIVEGSEVNTKYGMVHTDHILFVAAGAFHISKPSDLIPELQGRFPIRVELNDLTAEDFIKILKEPKNSLTKQYIALFESEGVVLEFAEEALETIAQMAFDVNAEIENIGARRLHTVMGKLLNDFLFDMPDKIKSKSVIQITHKEVEDKLRDLVKNNNLSEYIL